MSIAEFIKVAHVCIRTLFIPAPHDIIDVGFKTHQLGAIVFSLLELESKMLRSWKWESASYFSSFGLGVGVDQAQGRTRIGSEVGIGVGSRESESRVRVE